MIILLAGLLTVAVWQLPNEHSKATSEDRNRQAAADVARRFAIALTTYDYAHTTAQMTQVRAVSSQAVADRVRAAFTDLATSEATSIGEVTYSLVATETDSRMEVFVGTLQVVSGVYVRTGTSVAGLLVVTLGRSSGVWVVSDYRWVAAPVSSP